MMLKEAVQASILHNDAIAALQLEPAAPAQRAQQDVRQPRSPTQGPLETVQAPAVLTAHMTRGMGSQSDLASSPPGRRGAEPQQAQLEQHAQQEPIQRLEAAPLVLLAHMTPRALSPSLAEGGSPRTSSRRAPQPPVGPAAALLRRSCASQLALGRVAAAQPRCSMFEPRESWGGSAHCRARITQAGSSMHCLASGGWQATSMCCCSCHCHCFCLWPSAKAALSSAHPPHFSLLILICSSSSC